MSDDEPFRPPRRWPPLSAVGAGGMLVLLPLVMCGLLLATGQLSQLVLPFVFLVVATVTATGIWFGRRAGVVVGLSVLALVLLAQVASAVVGVRNGAGRAVLIGSVIVLGWLFLTGFLIWWPATRMWCGWLDPDPYGEVCDD